MNLQDAALAIVDATNQALAQAGVPGEVLTIQPADDCSPGFYDAMVCYDSYPLRFDLCLGLAESLLKVCKLGYEVRYERLDTSPDTNRCCDESCCGPYRYEDAWVFHHQEYQSVCWFIDLSKPAAALAELEDIISKLDH